MNFDDFGPLFAIIGIFVLLVIGGFTIQYSLDNVPLRISVDGREVYHGRSACVDTESIGSSSRVDVKTGPWCLFPKEYFAGKDVIIKTESYNG